MPSEFWPGHAALRKWGPASHRAEKAKIHPNTSNPSHPLFANPHPSPRNTFPINNPTILTPYADSFGRSRCSIHRLGHAVASATMPDPHYADLILSHQQPTLSSVLSTLRRATLSPHNRLASIRADAEFVSRVEASLAPRPLVANERCGSWYVPPARKAASAYFKSTDGHERAWKFSTRRLNLHLVELVEKNDG